jgi:hypothetical protein
MLYDKHVAENELVRSLADTRMLGVLLDQLRERFGAFELLHHHQQGEFHHDVMVRVPGSTSDLPGEFLVVATNCNGGVKEVLCFAELPTADALWHERCPDNDEFTGWLPPVLAVARTEHWFDPCELLKPDARSELRPEFRARQRGGGWCKRQPAE